MDDETITNDPSGPRGKHAYKHDLAPDGRKKGTIEKARWRERHREHWLAYHREKQREYRARKRMQEEE